MILVSRVPMSVLEQLYKSGFNIKIKDTLEETDEDVRLVVSADEEVIKAAVNKGLKTIAVIERPEHMQKFRKYSCMVYPEEVCEAVEQLGKETKEAEKEKTFDITRTEVITKPLSIRPDRGYHFRIRSEVIAVTGGKGGTGKTTVAACLGIMLARHGMKTIIVDMDLRAPSLDSVMQAKASRSLADLLTITELDMTEPVILNAAVQHPKSGAYLLLSRRGSEISGADMEKVLNALSIYFDVVVLDMGCLNDLTPAADVCLNRAKKILVVTTLTGAALKLARDWFEEHRLLNPGSFGIVANRVGRSAAFTPDTACRVLGLDLLAVLPETPDVLKGEANGLPLPKKGRFTKEIERLADKIVPGFKSHSAGIQKKPGIFRVKEWFL